MIVTAKTLFQYLLILLVVLWPVWVLVFVFGRLLVLKIRSLFKGKIGEPPRIAPPAVIPPRIAPPKPVEETAAP